METLLQNIANYKQETTVEQLGARVGKILAKIQNREGYSVSRFSTVPTTRIRNSRFSTNEKWEE